MMNLQSRFHRLVHSDFFNRFSLGVILTSAVLIGVETVDSVMAQYGHSMKFIDGIILTWFVIEILCRMAAHGRKPYLFFKCPWNVFDFFIVVLTLLPAVSPAIAVLRLFRIFRVLRLFSALPELQILVSALLKTLPSMGYVGLLLFLVVYVYGVLGVHIFKQIDPVHFGNLGLSLLTLFQVMTLEGWGEIFRPLFEDHGWLAGVYFLSFIFLGTMVLMNLMIGVVLRSMEQVQEEKMKVSHQRGIQNEKQDLEEILKSLDYLSEKVKRCLNGLP